MFYHDWVGTATLNSTAIGTSSTHPPMARLNRGWQALRRYTYPKSTAAVVLTDDSRRWFDQHFPGVPVRVIPNPVVWPLPVSEPIVAPSSYVGADEKMLLAAGRLVHAKGFDILIEAFAAVERKFPDWRLAILGEGSERLPLEDRLHQLGIKERVIMPGRVGNLRDWYENSDLFVLSSRWEGFSNVLIEAMAHGKPVVSFDCPTGPKTIIRHGVDGVLVPMEKGSIGLAQSLENLMSDAALRRSMGHKALKVKERFSMDIVLRHWDELFAWCNRGG